MRIAQELKKQSITLVPQVNERGDETTGFSQFSAKFWSLQTRQFLVSANELTSQEMHNIMAASKPFAGRISTLVDDDDSSDEDDDPRCHLVRRSAPQAHEEDIGAPMDVEEAQVADGWGLIPKSIQDLDKSSDVEIIDTPVPKKPKCKQAVKSNKLLSSSSGAGPSKKHRSN